MSQDGRSRADQLTASERRELLARLLRERAARGPLSFAQERLWFLHQLLPDSPVYNVPAAFRLRGPLDGDVLAKGLALVASRHAVLRSRFERTAGGAIARIEESLDLAVPIERLDDEASGATPFERALERANREVRRPFDLERAPLWRVLLLRLGAEDHLLVLTFHHIIAEGWSIALFCQELERAHAALVAGNEPELPALPIQYTDYARWQRRRADEPELDEEVEYWRRRLAGELPVLELPTDHARPKVQTFAGAWASRRIEAGLTTAAERLARAHSTTPFMVHLAVFDTLLHRYTGQQDVLVGCPIAGRNRAEAEALIGPFINTLVVRTDLGGDPTFDDLVERVRQDAVGAFSHQELPFERIIERIQPRRHLSHTPIFQVMFAMQNTPLPALTLAGLEPAEVLDPGLIHNGTTKVDLALFVEPAGDGLEVGCEYSTELFEAATIERLLGHYARLLESAVAEPSRPLSRLPLLSPEERRRALEEWNDSRLEVPQRSVVAIFAERATERPAALAVEGPDGRYTYGELDAASNRLARYLLGLGVGEESPVAYLGAPSRDMPLAMLAIAKAGGAYLPLDPAHPPDRIGTLLADAGVEVLLTHEALLAELPPTRGRVVALDRDLDAWSGAGSEPLGLEIPADRLAYVIYTSGSTGRPKGVQIEHRGLANLAAWHRTTYDVTPADRATQLAGPAFDASVWEIWPYLTAGASIDVVDADTRLSPDDLIGHLAARRITIAFAPTPLAEALLDRPWPGETSLRLLLAGGSQLHRFAPEEARFRLVNHYGPTENSVVSTAAEVERGEREGLPPIGTAIANHRLHVLDPRLDPVPVGIAGEIFVSGPGLARGYLGQPAATAAAFLPDPFGTEGGRLYATGDVARRRADGTVDFLGRRDHQIKLRGHRIELGEIEARLRRHEAVDEAVVVLLEPEGKEAYLAAYYATGEERVDGGELRRWARRTLPEYMVPARWQRLDSMPLTANGKVDRAALPDPEPAAAVARPAAGRLEGLAGEVAAIWSEVLPSSSIGAEDSFFDLGGNSLMLVEVHAQLRRRFGSELTMVDMFRHPTIASLVERLESESGRGAGGGERP